MAASSQLTAQSDLGLLVGRIAVSDRATMQMLFIPPSPFPTEWPRRLSCRAEDVRAVVHSSYPDVW